MIDKQPTKNRSLDQPQNNDKDSYAKNNVFFYLEEPFLWCVFYSLWLFEHKKNKDKDYLTT